MRATRAVLIVGACVAVMSSPAIGQATQSLPTGLEPQTRRTIEALADSLKGAGLPTAPIYAKASEGKLKLATDAQIIEAVRRLARRFGEIRSALGPSIDGAAMTSAATALSVGVPMTDIKGLLGAAGTSGDANAEFATALITLTDLVEQHVPTASASTAVEALLARRAPADQYARLRVEVRSEIGSGHSPEQAVRARTEAIVRGLPGPPPSIVSR